MFIQIAMNLPKILYLYRRNMEAARKAKKKALEPSYAKLNIPISKPFGNRQIYGLGTNKLNTSFFKV